jgi:hypothetical protein
LLHKSKTSYILKWREYYPSGDLLKSEMKKKGSSFTWKSVYVGLQILKKGHIWRVGQGLGGCMDTQQPYTPCFESKGEEHYIKGGGVN